MALRRWCPIRNIMCNRDCEFHNGNSCDIKDGFKALVKIAKYLVSMEKEEGNEKL